MSVPHPLVSDLWSQSNIILSMMLYFSPSSLGSFYLCHREFGWLLTIKKLFLQLRNCFDVFKFPRMFSFFIERSYRCRASLFLIFVHCAGVVYSCKTRTYFIVQRILCHEGIFICITTTGLSKLHTLKEIALNLIALWRCPCSPPIKNAILCCL